MTESATGRGEGRLSYEQEWFCAYPRNDAEYALRYYATFGSPVRSCDCESAYVCTHRNHERPLTGARTHW